MTLFQKLVAYLASYHPELKVHEKPELLTNALRELKEAGVVRTSHTSDKIMLDPSLIITPQRIWRTEFDPAHYEQPPDQSSTPSQGPTGSGSRDSSPDTSTPDSMKFVTTRKRRPGPMLTSTPGLSPTQLRFDSSPEASDNDGLMDLSSESSGSSFFRLDTTEKLLAGYARAANKDKVQVNTDESSEKDLSSTPATPMEARGSPEAGSSTPGASASMVEGALELSPEEKDFATPDSTPEFEVTPYNISCFDITGDPATSMVKSVSSTNTTQRIMDTVKRTPELSSSMSDYATPETSPESGGAPTSASVKNPGTPATPTDRGSPKSGLNAEVGPN